MELRVLGLVEVRAGGRSLDLGPPQRRVMLAALAVDAGRLVSRQTLIDRVWGQGPPARVDAAVYVHVTHIRRVIDQGNAAENGRVPVTLECQTGGYVLRIDADELDLRRFRRLAGAARERDCTTGERARLLREALALWRGPALAGLSGEWVSRTRDHWAQEPLDAMVQWAAAECELGRYDEAISAVRPRR